jgi:hypothetical protein
VSEAVRASFRDQARASRALGSPFTARLCDLLAERLEARGAVGARVLGWTGEPSGKSDALALRVTGALHAEVLGGTSPALAAAYPPHEVADEALWAAIAEALATREEAILAFLDSPPQTNEVGRSAAMIAAGHLLHARFPLPFVLSELGASAGLNLNWDRFALETSGGRLGDGAPVLAPTWHGEAPVASAPVVVDRRGVDLRPIDLADPAQRLRLRAYVWPDQAARLAALDAALAHPPAPVDRGDAGEWLARRLGEPRLGHLHMVWHTIAWQYFPPGTRATCEAALEGAGALATEDAPLARLAMEADGAGVTGAASGGEGAALTLTVWPGGEPQPLGRIHFHGRWIDWRP